MVDKTKLLEEIRTMLAGLFELAPEEIKPDSRLNEDLDLDSIDAVDMIVYVQKLLHKRIDPQTFRSVTTVNDIVEVVAKILQEQGLSSLGEPGKKQ